MSRPTLRRPGPSRPASRRPIGGAPVRRPRSVRRASAGLSPLRAGAALVVLLSAAAIYGVANSAAFEVGRFEVEGADLTAATDVEAALAGVRGQNLFRLTTTPLEASVRELTTVADASVSVRLPDTVIVRLRERAPILVWRVGERQFLVDTEGTLFAALDETPAAGTADLPVVDDRRAASTALSVGGRLDSIDLDAATRLGSLVPADVGSEASTLGVIVSDASGFVVRADPQGWDAVFGFYTPSLRTPELIPGQVRLLRSLIVGREPVIDKIILASDTDGTYLPKATPTPTPEPSDDS